MNKNPNTAQTQQKKKPALPCTETVKNVLSPAFSGQIIPQAPTKILEDGK